MHGINHHPPEVMTAEQRRTEAAALLAKGLVRLRAAGNRKSTNVVGKSEFELGFSGNQRVHSDPVNKTSTESK